MLPWPSLQVPVRHPANAAVQSDKEDDDVDVSSLPPYAASPQAIDLHVMIAPGPEVCLRSYNSPSLTIFHRLRVG